jgi:hypothetical protein
LAIEALPEEKARLMPESIEPRPDFVDGTELLCLQQDTQNSHRTKTEANRCTTRLLLVEQNEIGFQLDGKRKRLSFTLIQITPEDYNQTLVAHILAPNPGGALDFVASRMSPPALIQLIPNTIRNVDLAIEPAKQLEMTDRGKTGQR